MSLIMSSLWNWLQGFPCKNTIKLFLLTSCFINTVFFLRCLRWKNTITWKWNIKMLIRKSEIIWHWRVVVYRWQLMLMKQYIRYWHLSVSFECCSCLKKEEWDSTNALIITAVQINVMDVKIVSRQNFDCNAVFRVHKTFWLLPYSHALWVVLISCFKVQNSFIIQLSK